ncbi:hypothetical protein [Leuconostoc pseudomesenteroides]|uniref:hypothetical protein n=1 Tax=Leuconostoc pseudomesenteroides TaxID=33968 RepID=UPI001121CB09|nr:hypothetical protein [Leuconostoc pseudomesenteroides]TOZ04121.1 hypothetical protein DIS14_08320 [Leuconostoc pseudomesenteroides]
MTNRNINIVKIINETTFILNAGKDDGIEKGTKFKIIDSESEPVFDPFSGKTIGYLDTSKGTILADEVQNKMTIARTELIASTQRAPIYETFAALQPSTTYHREELNVDQTQITGGLNRSNNPIKLGDEVVKLSDPSE